MTGNYRAKDLIKQAGNLVIIGGGHRPDYLMLEFIKLAGGFDSQITILPAASYFPEQRGKEVKKELEGLGCTNVNYICRRNNEIDDEENLKKLEDTKGIFFTGGDQNKLAEFLLNTMVLEKIKEIYRHGGVIAGTSAGAAIMSKIMIAGYDPDWDDSIETPFQAGFRPNRARLSEGFGFLHNVIIDQHFNTRKRTERLKDAIKKNPGMLGVGIDESTAIIVHSDNTFHVVGENTVTLFSLSDFGLVQKTGTAVNLLNSGEIQTLSPGDKYLFQNYTSN